MNDLRAGEKTAVAAVILSGRARARGNGGKGNYALAIIIHPTSAVAKS